MPCRGGLLLSDQVGSLVDNKPLCSNIKEHWSDYVELSDKAVQFGLDQAGEQELLALDVLKMLRNGIVGKAHKFDLNNTVRDAEMSQGEAVDMIARAVFESRENCPGSIRKLLRRCQGDGG